MLAVSSHDQFPSGVCLSWFLIMSFYYFISLFSMQKRFEDLLRNQNITTEVRAKHNFPLLFSDWTCYPCCWNNRVIWHHVYGSRRLSSLFDNVTKISPHSFCLRFFMIIPTQKRNFIAVSFVRTKLDSFYLHISSFEKLAIWIWYLPFVVNAILNLFNTHEMLSRQ